MFSSITSRRLTATCQRRLKNCHFPSPTIFFDSILCVFKTRRQTRSWHPPPEAHGLRSSVSFASVNLGITKMRLDRDEEWKARRNNFVCSVNTVARQLQIAIFLAIGDSRQLSRRSFVEVPRAMRRRLANLIRRRTLSAVRRSDADNRETLLRVSAFCSLLNIPGAQFIIKVCEVWEGRSESEANESRVASQLQARENSSCFADHLSLGAPRLRSECGPANANASSLAQLKS